MKKIVYYALISGSVLIFAGCSSSGKPRVSMPSPPVPQTQPAPIKVRDIEETKAVHQPRYLEIGDNEEVILEDDIESNLPSMVFVNDRIFEYGRKLDRWKKLDEQSAEQELGREETVQMIQCFRELQKIINDYTQLRGKMLQTQKMSTAEEISNSEIFELQKSDVAFLESTCGRLLEGSKDQGIGWSQREEKADLAQLETLIDRYGESREYEEIVQVWMKIPQVQLGRVHLRTKILYGNALMYLHQETKAADIYQQVVDQMSASKEQATDLVSLRKILADLYTASGNYQEAESQYKKISDDYQRLGRHEEWSKLQLSILDKSMDGSPELTEFSSLLRSSLGFRPEKDGYKVVWQAEKFLSNYPYSPVSPNVDFIKATAQEGADRWFSDFILEVDELATEKQYEKAIELLETMPLDIVGAEKKTVIDDKNQEILLNMAVERETEVMAQIQELQRQWNNGMLLVTNGRYDEALDVFTNLLDTEYSAKARQKIDEVSLQAAKADRRKAADLFIRFTKTTDLESRKKLLIESRKLLKGILTKYPEVEIAAKVRGNIERVEQEMTAIDPNLMFMADQEEPVVDEDRLDAAFSPPTTPGNLNPESSTEENIKSGVAQ